MFDDDGDLPPAVKTDELSLSLPILALGGQNAVASTRSEQPFDALEVSVETVAIVLNGEPVENRRRFRQRAKYLAAESRAAAREDENGATTSAAVGGIVGGGVFTSALVALATNPISLALVLVMVTGLVVLASGLGAGFVLSRSRSRHIRRAEIFDALAQEINK